MDWWWWGCGDMSAPMADDVDPNEQQPKHWRHVNIFELTISMNSQQLSLIGDGKDATARVVL